MKTLHKIMDPIYFAGLVKDHIKIWQSYSHAGVGHGQEEVAQITTPDAWDAFWDQEGRREQVRRGEAFLLCSSSLDFPEEHTEDQRLIDLCNSIRGGGCGEMP